MKLSVLSNAQRALSVCGSLGAALLVSACGGGADATGPSGQSIALRTVAELAGANCATGGTKIEAGPDVNANGLLEDREVNSTAYVCNGQSGLAGVAGVAGVGTVGATGPVGPAGPAGALGLAGATGLAGASGPAGTIGATGPAGAAGTAGATGPAGAPGTAGATGPAGAPGTTGATGPAGAPGTAGATGPTGAPGTAGATGPAGAPGTAGATGPTGAPGTAGATGPAGAPGTAGATGPTGAPGTAGATGPTGAAGQSTVIQSCTVPAATQAVVDACGDITTGISTLIQAGADTGKGVPDDPAGITSAVMICGTGSITGSVFNPRYRASPNLRITCATIK
jgi:hypothetical protein